MHNVNLENMGNSNQLSTRGFRFIIKLWQIQNISKRKLLTETGAAGTRAGTPTFRERFSARIYVALRVRILWGCTLASCTECKARRVYNVGHFIFT
jgi:hypothetical protein